MQVTVKSELAKYFFFNALNYIVVKVKSMEKILVNESLKIFFCVTCWSCHFPKNERLFVIR